MSALIFSPVRRVCLNCIRKTFCEDTQAFGASLTQVRGKKKKAKSDGTIKVRLLVDMKGYGRKGTITPVAPGRMRNSWYPRQHAEYLSTLTDIDPKTVVAVRDTSFGLSDLEQMEKSKSGRDMVILLPSTMEKTKLLDPQLATELLSELLPSILVFHRTAIDAQALTESPQIPSRRATSKAAQETYTTSESENPARDTASEPRVLPVFGSVSTLDIANSIKDIMSKSEKGRRVVVGAEDITILADDRQGAVEAGGDRLKALGDFHIEIRVKGGDVLKRMVSIKPPDPTVSLVGKYAALFGDSQSLSVS